MEFLNYIINIPNTVLKKEKDENGFEKNITLADSFQS